MPYDVTLPTKYAITKVGEDAYEVITIYLDTGMAEWACAVRQAAHAPRAAGLAARHFLPTRHGLQECLRLQTVRANRMPNRVGSDFSTSYEVR